MSNDDLFERPGADQSRSTGQEASRPGAPSLINVLPPTLSSSHNTDDDSSGSGREDDEKDKADYKSPLARRRVLKRRRCGRSIASRINGEEVETSDDEEGRNRWAAYKPCFLRAGQLYLCFWRTGNMRHVIRDCLNLVPSLSTVRKPKRLDKLPSKEDIPASHSLFTPSPPSLPCHHISEPKYQVAVSGDYGRD